MPCLCLGEQIAAGRAHEVPFWLIESHCKADLSHAIAYATRVVAKVQEQARRMFPVVKSEI